MQSGDFVLMEKVFSPHISRKILEMTTGKKLYYVKTNQINTKELKIMYIDPVSSNSLQHVDAVGSLYLQLAFLNENTELKRSLDEGRLKYTPTPQEREKVIL